MTEVTSHNSKMAVFCNIENSFGQRDSKSEMRTQTQHPFYVKISELPIEESCTDTDTSSLISCQKQNVRKRKNVDIYRFEPKFRNVPVEPGSYR